MVPTAWLPYSQSSAPISGAPPHTRAPPARGLCLPARLYHTQSLCLFPPVCLPCSFSLSPQHPLTPILPQKKGLGGGG